MRFVSKKGLAAEDKLYERPFMKRLEDGGEVSMKEVRDFMLSFLAEYETFSLCSKCPEYKGTTNKTACCAGCPLHDMEAGCTLRNTGCLGWSCHSLGVYLRKNGGWEEFNAISAIFQGLDSFRGQYRLPDDMMIRLRDHPWGIGRARAETVEDGWSLREEAWTHEQETEAQDRHRLIHEEEGR